VRGDTLDTLALYYYNNPTYFWVIADFNRIQDPYADLVVDSVLRIPTFSNIAFDI
jgi:nucleoid-associated protein YgaU